MVFCEIHKAEMEEKDCQTMIGLHVPGCDSCKRFSPILSRPVKKPSEKPIKKSYKPKQLSIECPVCKKSRLVQSTWFTFYSKSNLCHTCSRLGKEKKEKGLHRCAICGKKISKARKTCSDVCLRLLKSKTTLKRGRRQYGFRT